ncbi:DUF2089 domain-containing protein [Dehalogenimonas alkenigignens]|uniref:DUF2089 domain-containing protein n=1 Tax=Dehalogenimonas alkenigignens TaxID=1217799 RepID=A0A0W0GHC1_9CHLR|nr:DUF2089 domain-containing protein [Dehalogenimonas alkenigignens]KTB47962.1 hypothetical protein DEALK_08070 [Dehalogenimonas alkenigignens]PVV83225.1 DUF2089 domain-containing protein [Dehalogenimonas alkenigignens]
MIKEWNELTRLTGGAALVVERVRLAESGIAIEGEFAPPVLATLSAEDQVFIMAFIGAHGSIKDMERLFGISYPTVKNRLDKLANRLKMVEFEAMPRPAADSSKDVLEMLERGEISADEAVRRLE